MNANWVEDLHLLSLGPKEPILSWLTEPKIISEALKRHYAHFSLQLVSQSFQKPSLDEAQILNINKLSEVFVRVVLLEGDNIPRTAGQVIVPLPTFEAYREQFLQLGNKPLGETLLYDKEDVKRSAFSYAFIEEISPDIPFSKQGLWARRSLFYLKNHPLIVTEYFLPTLDTYVALN